MIAAQYGDAINKDLIRVTVLSHVLPTNRLLNWVCVPASHPYTHVRAEIQIKTFLRRQLQISSGDIKNPPIMNHMWRKVTLLGFETLIRLRTPAR